LQINGTYHLLICADVVNVVGGSLLTTKKNTEALVAVSQEIGLELNADKTDVHGHVSRSECWTHSPYRA